MDDIRLEIWLTVIVVELLEAVIVVVIGWGAVVFVGVIAVELEAVAIIIILQ